MFKAANTVGRKSVRAFLGKSADRAEAMDHNLKINVCHFANYLASNFAGYLTYEQALMALRPIGVYENESFSTERSGWIRLKGGGCCVNRAPCKSCNATHFRNDQTPTIQRVADTP